ncbi:type IV pilus modification protein PilV [Sulfuriflexus mobilis]|uniref:type IV pilus modification protein PilV n=1 Tax=Sulfuriflexus mobilis TaxID=1811807 RepID=UPI000F839B7A|nr:type IV pilus modification protein PilV [Sulfuriflexus mobilis]
MSLIMMHSKPDIRGFSLVEVLVAVFVLAIGLLGLAGLQAKSLQFNYSAYQRSQATMLAYDIIDRMRANLGEAQATPSSYDIADNVAPSTSKNCQTNDPMVTCTAAEMASFDLNQWKCALSTTYDANTVCTGLGIKGALLEATGSIATAGGITTVTIVWVDDRTKTGDDRKTTFTVSTKL